MELKEAVSLVASLMELSCCTAPKSLGQNFVRTKVLAGEDLKVLAEEMIKYGKEKGDPNFDRDAEGVRRSEALLLVSIDNPTPLGLNCGACGCERCADLNSVEGPEFKGPLCSWRYIDLGIALGSAVKTASLHNVDNRIMYRAGVVARRMGLIDGELAVGVPLSATGKNIFFDRPAKK